ncbi:MAG TPA: hypothetical protein VHZ96_00255 [Frankiaceae bacterium]|jgi:hypothetical protein|nr:hypothetical protein [Frankiaceae bacterium]
MRRSFRPIAASLVAGTLAVGVAACGSSSTGSSSTPSSSPSSASTKAILTVPALTGVQTSVTLDANLLPTLTSLHVTPAPTGTGTLTMPGGAATLNFPITGGNVTLYNKGAVTPYVQGIIHHNGSGVSLTAGGKTLTVENFDVDPGKSLLTAQVKQMNDAAIPLFFLDGSNLQITPPGADGIAKLDGTKVELTAEAADAINKYFGVTAFKKGILFGIAHIQAKG